MRLRDYVLLAELDLDDTNTDATQDRRPVWAAAGSSRSFLAA